jgi:hypothetical protein
VVGPNLSPSLRRRRITGLQFGSSPAMADATLSIRMSHGGYCSGINLKVDRNSTDQLLVHDLAHPYACFCKSSVWLKYLQSPRHCRHPLYLAIHCDRPRSLSKLLVPISGNESESSEHTSPLFFLLNSLVLLHSPPTSEETEDNRQTAASNDNAATLSVARLLRA